MSRCLTWMSATAVAVAVSIGVTTAATADEALPRRSGIDEIAEMIVNGDCRLCVIGDSNASKTSSPRLLGGIMRTFAPEQWVGRVSQPYRSSNEGTVIDGNWTGWDHVNRRIRYPGDDPNAFEPMVWSNGDAAFSPIGGIDLVTEGTGLDDYYRHTFLELTRLEEYPGGDWATDAPMRVRLIHARSSSGITQLRYRADRGSEHGPWSSFSPLDAAAETTYLSWVDADVPEGQGAIITDVRPMDEWTNDHKGTGAPWPCPENCTAGQTYYHVAQMAWRTDVEGLQIDAIAHSGWTAWDHLEEAQYITQTALEEYLLATREPNVFLILLGQNMKNSELNDIETVWRANIEGIIDRYVAASLANDPDAQPMFILVSPWETSGSDRFQRMAQVMFEISVERPDVGFINLHNMAGSYADTQGVYLELGGVHFKDDDGADYFTSLIWGQIRAAANGNEIIPVPGLYPTIQDAIDAAAGGDEIMVAPGTYAESVHFNGKPVYLRSTHGAQMTTIDAAGTGLCAVAAINGESSDSVLEGFTLTGGIGLYYPELGGLCGGGLSCYGGSPTIRRCVVTGNTASSRGGGVLVAFASPELVNVEVHGNEAPIGGGMATWIAGPSLLSCHLHDNTAAVAGGGMHSLSSWPTVELSTIEDNVATGSGGGVDGSFGTLSIVGTVIRRNQAQRGGGIALDTGSLQLDTSELTENTTTELGGGGVSLTSSATAVLVATRVESNTAAAAGGGIEVEASVELDESTVCSNLPDQIEGDWTDGGDSMVGDACVCPGDTTGDGQVDVQDILAVLSAWGPCEGCSEDVDESGSVDVGDILAVLSQWGPCP